MTCKHRAAIMLRMARTDPQVNLRIPAELKDALDAAAEANKRSLTAEIVARLERTVSDRPAINGLSMAELFKKLEQLEALIKSGEFTPFSQTRASHGSKGEAKPTR